MTATEFGSTAHSLIGVDRDHGDHGRREQREAAGQQQELRKASRHGLPWRPWRCVDRRVLSEDRGLEVLEVSPRLEAELLAEAVASLPVDLERFRLPAGAVEGEHQPAAQPLPRRMCGDQ